MRTVIRRMLGLVMIAEAAFVLSTVFTNVSRGVAFVAYNTRSFRGKVGSRDESCAHSGELMVPTRIVDSRSLSGMYRDFNPRGRFGGYDDWVMGVRECHGF